MKLFSHAKLCGLAAVVAVLGGAGLPVRADYFSTVMSLNPVMYWRLNETTPVPVDVATNCGSLGAAVNGIYQGAVIHPGTSSALAGSADTAADFAGGGVSIPFNAALNPSGPFTAECWANPTTNSGTQFPLSPFSSICGPMGPSDRQGWVIYQNGTNWQFRLGDAAGYVAIVEGGAANVGVWHHVVGVYDGTNACLYVNGLLAAGPVVPSRPFSPNPSHCTDIGTASAFGRAFYGPIDEAAIYPSALSAAQILTHYRNATNPAPAASYGSLVLGDGAIGYWRLDEPAWVDPGALLAVNTGTRGSAADGVYGAGVQTGLPGASYPGFETNHYACAMNGSIGSIAVPGQSINTANLTITCWIKRSAGDQPPYAALLYQRPQQPAATGLNFGASNDLQESWNESPNWLSGLIVPADQWTFVAMVITPTNSTLYLNDQSATHDAAHAAHDWSASTIYIGQDPGSATRFYHGLIDEVAVFTNSLSADQVLQLYGSAEGRPVITEQPQAPADGVSVGMDITLTVSASGNPPLWYQWTKNANPIAGATTTALALTNLALSDSGAYAVVITNAYGATTSSIVTLDVQAGPPSILQQPQPLTRFAGATAAFSLVADGPGPYAYQWKKNDSPLTGATQSSLVLASVQAGDSGSSYSVTVTTPFGSANSAGATLTVIPVTNYSAVVMSGNPRAYWRLNESGGGTAYDYAGGYDGTFGAGVTTGVAGPQPPAWPGLEPSNEGFVFDGTNGNIALPALGLNTNAITITCWLNPTVPETPYAGIFFNRNDAGNMGLHFGVDGELRHSWDASDSDPPSWNSRLVPLPGRWNFVALVITPTSGTLYLDDGTGSGLRSATHHGSYHPMQFNTTWIGQDPCCGGRYVRGGIDEVAFYDHALSPAEIQNLDLMATTGPTPAVILENPVSQTVFAGQSARFTVGAIGGVPLSYQWLRAGTNLPGATLKTYTIPSAYYTDSDSYQVIVTNALGSAGVSSAATLTVLARPSFANLPHDLVLHLRFDGDYTDSSGRGNNGSAGGTPWFVTGKIGTAAVHVNTDTNGTNYVSLPSSPDLAFGAADSFAVAFWVRYTGLPNDLPMIGNSVNSTYQPGWVLSDDHGQIEWTLVDTDTGTTVIADPVGGPLINDGVWHNIVLSIDRTNTPNTAATYVDGVQIDIRSIDGLGSLDTGKPVTIGQDPTGAYNVSGAYDIDDVGIWRRALSAYDAAGLYAAGQIGQSFDVVGPEKLTARLTSAGLELIWATGTLQWSDQPTGPWNAVTGAAAPYYRVAPNAGKKFYRVGL